MAKLDLVDSTPREASDGLPEKVGPYRIVSRLGVGGMGEVYRAFDARLDRHVAIKHIHPEAAEDPKIRRRLRREAHAVAKLNHPAIVQIYDILEEDDGDWIVMELVEGQTLHDLIKGHRLTLAQALFLASEVANGLAEAHFQGVVHRDLKSENVMVTPAGHAKILDFGLAKLLLEGAGDTILSIHGTIVGTGRAMSPEQAKGESVDHRSDLFSLGSLLFEIVTGRAPFVGSSIIATLTRICSEEPPRVSELNPQVPDELCELIAQLMSKKADQRPSSAEEVAATLMDIASRLPPEQADRLTGSSPGTIAALAPTPTSRIRRPESSRSVFIKTLASVSLSGASKLAKRLGDDRAQEVLLRHDRLVRSLVARWSGVEASKGGSFLLVLERPVDAVELALAYHRKLAFLADELGLGVDVLRGRVAIHLGEIFYREDDPTWGHLPFEVDSGARRIVVRMEAMARPGQTLITQAAQDIARRALASPEGEERTWIAHGKYRLAQIGGTIRLCEVRSAEAPALKPPIETDEALRLGDLTREISAPQFSLPKTRRTRRARRYASGAAWAVAALLVVALAVVGFSRWTAPTPGADLEVRTVVIEGFQPPGDASGDDALAVTLAEMVAVYLESGGGIRVLPTAELGPDQVLSGTCRSDGETGKRRIRWQLEMTAQSGGEPRRYDEAAPEGELVDLVARVGKSIRRDLGLPAVARAEREAFRASWPRNAKALRLYTEGLAEHRSQQPRRARDLLNRAIAQDPDHAPAHLALAEVLLALEEIDMAQVSAQQALELRDGLPRRWEARLDGIAREIDGWRAARGGNREAARRAFEEARRHFEDAGDSARVERVAAAFAAVDRRGGLQ